MKIPSKKIIDLTGKRFGRVTVLEYAGLNDQNAARWRCRCDCGTVFVTNANALRQGHTTSCGCYRSEVARKAAKIAKVKLAVPVEATKDGVTRRFNSMTDTAAFIGCAISTVQCALNHEKTYNGFTFKRLTDKRTRK